MIGRALSNYRNNVNFLTGSQAWLCRCPAYWMPVQLCSAAVLSNPACPPPAQAHPHLCSRCQATSPTPTLAEGIKASPTAHLQHRHTLPRHVPDRAAQDAPGDIACQLVNNRAEQRVVVRILNVHELACGEIRASTRHERSDHRWRQQGAAAQLKQHECGRPHAPGWPRCEQGWGKSTAKTPMGRGLTSRCLPSSPETDTFLITPT